jgi:hypothetical protein
VFPDALKSESIWKHGFFHVTFLRRWVRAALGAIEHTTSPPQVSSEYDRCHYQQIAKIDSVSWYHQSWICGEEKLTPGRWLRLLNLYFGVSWQNILFTGSILLIQMVPSYAVLRIAENPIRIRPTIKTPLSAIPKRSAE